MLHTISFFLGFIIAWQQSVSYKIQVRLQPDSVLLSATQRIHYTNHSPDTLTFVWLHLYPNAYQRSSFYAKEAAERGDFKIFRAPDRALGKITVDSFLQDDHACSTRVLDTEMKVWLAKPLLPGSTTTFSLRYKVKIPAFFSRMGHQDSHFIISQWYPKMVVYDNHAPVALPLNLSEAEYRGRSGWWHPDGYHYTGEFYGEYAAYDVWITVPLPFVVGATGELVGEDLLDSLKTLHFHAEQVHDFVWVADSNFVRWDTTYHQTQIQFLVLNRKDHLRFWKPLIREVPKILDRFSTWFYPYHYPTLTLVDASIGVSQGMEYPTVVLLSIPPNLQRLRSHAAQHYFVDITAHEIAHQWFYGILGNNEMDEAWLDEGFATFAEQRFMKWRMAQDPTLSDDLTRLLNQDILGTIETIALYWQIYSPWDEPILGKKAYVARSYWTNVYTKGAKLLWWMFDYLGATTFDSLIQGYFREYAFHHVTTKDFLRWVESHSDFPAQRAFEPWLHDTPKLDLTIRRIYVLPSLLGMCTAVEVERKGGDNLWLPVPLAVVTRHGDTLRRWIPADSHRIAVDLKARYRRVILDPDNLFPETDEWNNSSPREILWGTVWRVPPFRVNALWNLWAPWLTWDPATGWVPGIAIFGTHALLRHTFLLYGGYSWKNRKPMGGISLQEPISNFLTRWSISWSLFPGGSHFQWGLERTFMPRMVSASRQRVTVGIQREDIQDLRFYPSEVYDPGADLRAFVTYLLRKETPYWGIWGSMGAHIGLHPLRYQRLWIGGRVTFWRGIECSAWGYVGVLHGDAPRQEQFLLQGEIREPFLYSLLIPSTGAFSPVGEHLAIGYGMFAYAGIPRLGKVKGISGISLRYRWLELYGQLGNVWSGLRSVTWSSLLAEAGIALGGSWGKVVYPLWTRDSGWKFRFLVWIPTTLL